MEYQPTLRERFQGCLLGLAVGDDLVARFEGQPTEHIRSRHQNIGDLIAHPPYNELWYTDDTQMMIGVAEDAGRTYYDTRRAALRIAFENTRS